MSRVVPERKLSVTDCVGDCVVSCGTDGDATITGTTRDHRDLSVTRR